MKCTQGKGSNSDPVKKYSGFSVFHKNNILQNYESSNILLFQTTDDTHIVKKEFEKIKSPLDNLKIH